MEHSDRRWLGFRGEKTLKVITTDRNFWKPNKALECLSLSVNKEPSGPPEYKHSECCRPVNVKSMCMISPLTCWSCGNRAITVANKLHAHSAVVPDTGERSSFQAEQSHCGGAEIWRQVCLCMCVCVCVHVVQQGVLLSVLALSL